MTPPKRPLSGCAINLSISESDDSQRRGFPSWQVNRVTLQFAAALFGQGASVVFGHDWREDGIMEAVYGFARQVQPPVPLSRDQSVAESEPLLRNVLPWPEKPHLSKRDLEQLSSTLRVEVVGLPKALRRFDTKARRLKPSARLYKYVRARGLTFLRQRLNETSHARICIGGRNSDYAGRYPGLIEEAFLAIRDKKPLYLAGFLGGATEQVVNAIEGKQISDTFCRPTPLQEVYQDPPVNERDSATRADRVIDRMAVWKLFAETGRQKLAAVNGLTAKENQELFHTPVIERAIELILTGISRVRDNFAGTR